MNELVQMEFVPVFEPTYGIKISVHFVVIVIFSSTEEEPFLLSLLQQKV